MHTELLIGDIVRQTTVLIAQLSTAAGIRAPLAQVADQVFSDLARELESQGVRQKVAADMFGLALRTYQLKVRRIREGLDESQITLWQALHDELGRGTRTRQELEHSFEREEPARIAAILRDMVQSGVAYSSGRGQREIFGLTNEADRALLDARGSALASMLWYLVATDAADTPQDLLREVKCEQDEFDQALQELFADGRLETSKERLIAKRLEIPVGSERGWEVAVCDHYRAVTTAIAAKVATRIASSNFVGGGTVSYRLGPQHPLREEVLSQLDTVRRQVNELWRRVAEHNEEHGVPDSFSRVTFYFGQNVVENDEVEEA